MWKNNHIWITNAPADDSEELYLPRKIVLRMYWDGEQKPSVEVPLGDFFGLGDGITKNYTSAPLMMSPGMERLSTALSQCLLPLALS